MRVLAQPAGAAREANPYTWLLYRNMPCVVHEFSARRALLDRYSVLHLHWPEAHLNGSPTARQAWFRLQVKFGLIDLMRAHGTKVLWTVHNLAAHEGRYPRLEAWFWRQFHCRLDGYIALSESGRVEALKRFPGLRGLPGFVIPHGHYREEYPVDHTVDARAALGVGPDARVVLFFGQIRPYKNVSRLMEIARSVADRNLVLWIAGRPADAALAQEIAERAQADSRVRLKLEHISREETHLYFRCADLVVLPYREILNSGTALLALSHNRPVLVPNRGAMAELANQLGSNWVSVYDGELTPECLERALRRATCGERPPQAPLQHLDWQGITRQTLEAYRDVCRKEM